MPEQRQGLSQRIAEIGPQGGASGAGMAQALSSFIQTFQTGAQNLLKVVQQQQMENAQATADARTAASAGVEDVLNQMVRSVDKREEETRRGEEKAEGREYQEESLLWQRELQEESAKEGKAMDVAMRAQERNRLTFINEYERQGAVVGDAIEATRFKLEQLAESGALLNLRNGPVLYAKAMTALRHAEAWRENHQRAPYLAHANQITNQAISEILKSEDPGGELQKLSAMDERLLLLPAVRQTVEGDLPTMDKGRLKEVEWSHGYPPEGLQQLSPDSQDWRFVNPYTKASALRMMMADISLQRLTTKKARQMAIDGLNRMVIQAEDATKPFIKAEKSFEDVFINVSSEAIRRGILEFIQDPNPHKRDDIATTLTRKILAHMIPETGAAFADDAFKIRDGGFTTEEQNSGAMLYKALATKEAVDAIRDRLTKVMGNLKDPMMATLMQDIGAMDPSALPELGETPGIVKRGFIRTTPENPVVALHRRLWGLMGRVNGELSRIYDATRDTLPIRALNDEIGTLKRLADQSLLVTQSNQQAGDPWTPESVQQRLEEVAERTGPSPGFQRGIGYMEAAGVLFRDHPDKVGGLVDLYSGGKAKLEDPNLGTFQATTDVQAPQDVYLQRKIERRRTHWAGRSLYRQQEKERNQEFGSPEGQPAGAMPGPEQPAGPPPQQGLQQRIGGTEQPPQPPSPPSPLGAGQPQQPQPSNGPQGPPLGPGGF